jgi:phage gp16-like protein
MKRAAKPAGKPGNKPPPSRRALLAQVHMARKALALHEDSYRAILARIAGRESAGEIPDAGLVAVVAEFRRLGWKDRPFRPGSKKPHVRKVWAVWGSMKKLLRDPSADGLRGYVKRMTGLDDPEWMDGDQANRVVEGLKAWKRREERARREGEAGDAA